MPGRHLRFIGRLMLLIGSMNMYNQSQVLRRAPYRTKYKVLLSVILGEVPKERVRRTLMRAPLLAHAKCVHSLLFHAAHADGKPTKQQSTSCTEIPLVFAENPPAARLHDCVPSITFVGHLWRGRRSDGGLPT